MKRESDALFAKLVHPALSKQPGLPLLLEALLRIAQALGLTLMYSARTRLFLRSVFAQRPSLATPIQRFLRRGL